MLKHLGLDGWQAWDYAIARLYKRAETAEGVCNMCDVCGSPNGKEHGETCPIAIAEALMVRELRKCQAGHRRPVVYVAGRFRSADGWKVNENVFAAEKAGREVAALGAMPLVPHSIGAHMAGTEDDTFWLTGTLELMRRCDVVLVLPGYQESQGTMGEIAEAQRIGMPVIMPLDGAPGWEELRSRLKKPKVTVTFKGKEVPLLNFVHGVPSLTIAKQPGVVLKVQDEQQKTAELSVILRQSSGQSLVEAARAMRDRCDEQSKEVAGLSIGLGRREGETLLAAARRVRETGTHAEVERLTRLLEAAKQDAEDTRVRTSARIEKLCQESNAVAKALGDHHGKTDEEAALALVADLQETRDRHDKVAAVAEKLHKQVEDQARELDELRARHEDTRKQNEVASQQLGKHDQEALAHAARRVAQTNEAHALTIMDRDRQIEALRAAMNRSMSERDSLRTEVTMLRDELKTQKDEREEDSKEMAELAIELGQQVGETLIAALRRVRQTGTQAEVERLKGVCEHHAERLRQKHDEIEAIAKAIGEHDGMTDEEAVRALVAERDKLRGQYEDLNNRLKSAQLSKLDAALVLECGENESPSAAIRRVVTERDSLRKALANAQDERDQERVARLRMQADVGAELGRKPGEDDLMEVARRVVAERADARNQLSRALADKDMCLRQTESRIQEALAPLTQKLGAVQAELHILSKAYDEALELCDRDGMTPAEQIKELRKEIEDIRPEAEQMAGWRQSSLDRQIKIDGLLHDLATMKFEREAFVSSLCAELGVDGGERSVMTALEHLKAQVANGDAMLAEVRDRNQELQAEVEKLRLAMQECDVLRRQAVQESLETRAKLADAEKPKHPEWVRHTKGFNNLKPGTIAQVLGVQGDPPDTYKVKQLNGPEGSWIMANCEPCEPPAGISPAPATATADPTQDEPSTESADGLVIAD